MKRARLFSLLLVCLLLTGCASVAVQEPVMAHPFTRYYRASAGEELLAAETVDLGNEMPDYVSILNDYFAGPHLPGLVNPFPRELRCESVSVSDGVATIRLSEEFSTLAGIELTAAAAAIARTMEQFEPISSVCLQTEDVMLSDLWNRPFTAEAFVFSDTAGQ